MENGNFYINFFVVRVKNKLNVGMGRNFIFKMINSIKNENKKNTTYNEKKLKFVLLENTFY